MGTTKAANQRGHPVYLTCPDCGGTLWQTDHGRLLRFRCHTGHAFSAEALLKSSQESLEETLWDSQSRAKPVPDDGPATADRPTMTG